MTEEYISIMRIIGGHRESGELLEDSAYIALIVDGNATSSHKIGYYTDKGVFVSNPAELLAFINDIGIDKLTDIQAKYGSVIEEIPQRKSSKRKKG